MISRKSNVSVKKTTKQIRQLLKKLGVKKKRLVLQSPENSFTEFTFGKNRQRIQIKMKIPVIETHKRYNQASSIRCFYHYLKSILALYETGAYSLRELFEAHIVSPKWFLLFFDIPSSRKDGYRNKVRRMITRDFGGKMVDQSAYLIQQTGTTTLEKIIKWSRDMDVRYLKVFPLDGSIDLNNFKRKYDREHFKKLYLKKQTETIGDVANLQQNGRVLVHNITT